MRWKLNKNNSIFHYKNAIVTIIGYFLLQIGHHLNNSAVIEINILIE